MGLTTEGDSLIKRVMLDNGGHKMSSPPSKIKLNASLINTVATGFNQLVSMLVLLHSLSSNFLMIWLEKNKGH